MKSPALAAATATVLSLATAGIIPMVDLVAVNCPGGTESQRQFTFNLNYDEASKFDAPNVCGFNILDGSLRAAQVDPNTVVCQVFQDSQGRYNASGEFFFGQPARLTKTPVNVGSMWCATKDHKRPAFLGAQNGTFVPPKTVTFGDLTPSSTRMGPSVPTATASARPTGSDPGVPGMAGSRVGGGIWAGSGIAVVAALAMLVF